MRGISAFLTLAAVSALALAACSDKHEGDRGYAPASQQEPDPPASSDSIPTPEPQTRADGALPAAPIPYDQLDAQPQPGRAPDGKAAPKPKDNDKAIFY